MNRVYKSTKNDLNFSATRCFNSGLAHATGGKSFNISKGLQASITARELVLVPFGIRGSRGPLHAFRMN